MTNPEFLDAIAEVIYHVRQIAEYRSIETPDGHTWTLLCRLMPWAERRGDASNGESKQVDEMLERCRGCANHEDCDWVDLNDFAEKLVTRLIE